MYLGVLHTEHWEVGLMFLEAGKNVLCEKPFAMNSKQVKDLVAAAERNNVFLMEVRMKGHNLVCGLPSRGHLLAEAWSKRLKVIILMSFKFKCLN